MSKKKNKNRKKKKSSALSHKEKNSGMLMGMRNGFKKGAKVVAGSESGPKWLDWILTFLIILLGSYIVYTKFFK